MLRLLILLPTIVQSKNRIVILTINLSCLLQMSEPIWCMDTVNCQDGMRMWRKVDWEWGKDCHVVLLHIVMNCVHSSESEVTNCQSLWQFLFYSAWVESAQQWREETGGVLKSSPCCCVSPFMLCITPEVVFWVISYVLIWPLYYWPYILRNTRAFVQHAITVLELLSQSVSVIVSR